MDDVEAAPLGPGVAAEVGAGMRSLAVRLLFYKSIFAASDFDAFAIDQADVETSDKLRRIQRETVAEMRLGVEALRAWDATSLNADDVRALIDKHLLEDLLSLKESTTEAFLLAGMRAPTEDLRRRFILLADLDRQHGDTLREILGVHKLAHHLDDGAPPRPDKVVGAHHARLDGRGVVKSIKVALQALQDDGQRPERLVLSPVALRHVRDEGGLEVDGATVLGLPVDVDFGWRGECFAIRTGDHASLSEIATARHMEGR